jgi:hypothetical protein
MEELIVVVFQFVIEFTLNVLGHLPIDWPSKHRKTPERETLRALCFIWLVAGGLLGGLSLLFIDYALLQPTWLRLANLLISALASAFLAQLVASRRAQTNPFIVPRNHFWYGFWFSLGVAFIRFAYAARPA